MNQQLSYEIAAVMPAAVATGLFVSLCTFQVPDGLLGPSGAPSGTYVNATGLVDIPCMDAPQPPSEIKLGAFEDRQPGQVTDTAPRHVLLNSYYPTVMTQWREGMRAIVDGVKYDVCGAECDSQRTQVRLELKLVSAASPIIGTVTGIRIEGSGTGFDVGIATTTTTIGTGSGLTIQILTVIGDQIETYEILSGGEGYLVADAGQIVPNAGPGDPEAFLVESVA